MNVGAAIYGWLFGNAGVSAIVSDRIFRDMGPLGVWPQVSYELDQEEDTALDARTLQRFHLSVTCESLNHGEAVSLRDAVKATLDRQTYSTGDTSIVSCQYTGGDEDARPQDGGNVNRTYFAQDLTFSLLAKENS